MAETTVSTQDVQDAARFVREYVAAAKPEVDVTEGSMYSDVIEALAYIIAMLRQWRNTLRDLGSLRTLSQLPDDENVAEAANAVLSNWFFPRPAGTYARGVVTVHLSQKTDLTIRTGSRFQKTASLVYLLDAASDYFVSQDDLRPVLDSSGQVTDWIYNRLPVVATSTGEAWNQGQPGRFIAFDRFNSYATYIEHQGAITGGTGQQATSDYISQGRNAISLRALVNARSNRATLTQQFSELTRVVTVGNGAPEMVRDKLKGIGVGSALKLHLGGHVDIYGRLPIQEVTETLEIGGTFVRNDGQAVILRDTGRDFVSLGVLPGDVIHVSTGIPEAPFDFVISEVRNGEVEVSARTPFSVATDEDATSPGVEYTIGDDFPLFNNRVSATGGLPVTASGGTSRSMTSSGVVYLQGRPVYRVKEVAIRNPSSTFDAWRNSGQDVVFTQRVQDVVPVGVAGRMLSYAVRILDPDLGQSALGTTGIDIGWTGHPFDGETLTVVYDTATGFEALDSYVRDEQTRVSAANVVAKAFSPIYVSFQIPYWWTTDPDLLAAGTNTFNEQSGARAIESFITAYKYGDVLDYSRLSTMARTQSDMIGRVEAFPINYEFYAPDGKVARYSTTGALTLFADPTDNSATLLNPTELGFTTTGYTADLTRWLMDQGVSDRLLRYVAPTGSVNYYRRG
jgi:hypothetical protein